MTISHSSAPFLFIKSVILTLMFGTTFAAVSLTGGSMPAIPHKNMLRGGQVAAAATESETQTVKVAKSSMMTSSGSSLVTSINPLEKDIHEVDKQ